MLDHLLPHATTRYPFGKRHKATDKRDAYHALALTGGSGFVITSRYGKAGARRAARIAKAWDSLVDEAEARHIAFWGEYDREAA